MTIEIDRLEKPRVRGGKLVARCPACAEGGGDRSCEHLFIADEGRGPFGCIAYSGVNGEGHRRRIFELVGVHETRAHNCTKAIPLKIRPQPTQPRPMPALPALRPLTVTEMASLAAVRGWSLFAGLQLLANRGLLWYGDVWDAGQVWPAWIITDSSRRQAQARRLDGGQWSTGKVKGFKNNRASWPIGAADIGERPIVVLCEGQPDFCASLFVAWWEGQPIEQIAPVGITGAGNSITDDALGLFTGKRVRIAVHADASGKGQEAAFRWSQQLYDAGATHVDGFDFTGIAMADGTPCKDLADYATTLGLADEDSDESRPTPFVYSGLVMDAAEAFSPGISG
jgi:hypothetical protein